MPSTRLQKLAGVRAFTTRFAGAHIEGLPKGESSNVEERWVRLDELKANGTITQEEHAKQRDRILGEL